MYYCRDHQSVTLPIGADHPRCRAGSAGLGWRKTRFRGPAALNSGSSPVTARAPTQRLTRASRVWRFPLDNTAASAMVRKRLQKRFFFSVSGRPATEANALRRAHLAAPLRGYVPAAAPRPSGGHNHPAPSRDAHGDRPDVQFRMTRLAAVSAAAFCWLPAAAAPAPTHPPASNRLLKPDRPRRPANLVRRPTWSTSTPAAAKSPSASSSSAT
jgi:hypothetical protein